LNPIITTDLLPPLDLQSFLPLSYFAPTKKFNNMERKLATIARVLAIHPIEGADSIERLQIKGWNLVSQKGNFQTGDLCAYFEIDSFFPVREEFEFLRKSSFAKMADGSEGFRLRTIKLRGQVSQGLALPIREIKHMLPEDFKIEEGAEITDLLGIKKYEPPIPANLAGAVKGMFPSFIPKTDEERVQNLEPMIDELAGTEGYTSEKVDGSSMTIYLRDEDFGVCSRGLDLLESESNSMWKVARRLKLEEKLKRLGRNLALQGEIYGEGIQGNKLKRVGQHFALFNVFDIDSYAYLGLKEMLEIAEQLGIETVPILDDKHVFINSVEEYVKMSQVRSKINPDVWAEGIVIRPLLPMRWRGERVSFKSINPQFLLKYGE
jgi:RNA ligase (TIGR02306 family)